MRHFWQRWHSKALDRPAQIEDRRTMFPIRDHNPSERVPFVTYALIGLNILVYLYGLAALQSERDLAEFYYHYAMIPARVVEGDGYTGVFTSMFLHAGFLHLAGNMLFLFIFGDNLEDKMGHVPFLLFYLFCGVGATLAQHVTDPTSQVPLVGASGAIAGVMGGYLLLFPRARVDIFVFFIVFFRIFPIPAWIMLGLWFGLQLFNGVTADQTGGGVAYWAHAGGFIVGFIAILPFWLRLGGPRFWRRTEGHPEHPEASYGRSSVPVVRKR